MIFELLCYAAVIAAILYIRHEQSLTGISELPTAFPNLEKLLSEIEAHPEPITVIEFTPKPAKKPRQYAAANMNPIHPPPRVYHKIEKELPPFSEFDKNGNKLRGAALRKRRAKYGLPPEE